MRGAPYRRAGGRWGPFCSTFGLPDRDGLEAIAAIRAKHSLPIIVVTARDDTAEKITALDLGADDYVTKPFDNDELLARLAPRCARRACRRGCGSTEFRSAHAGSDPP